MTNLKDDSKRELFRPRPKINSLARIAKQDPNFTYKMVIYDETYPHNADNFEEHEAAGYEIVYTKDTVEDDRLFSVDNQDKDRLRQAPVIKRVKIGTEVFNSILMRISKEREKLNATNRNDKEDKMYHRKQKSYSREGNNIIVDDGEIDLTNIKKQVSQNQQNSEEL